MADRPKSVAARVLKELGLSVNGFEVGKLVPAGRGAANLAAVIRLLNREINERLGIANNQRGEVPAADMEAVMNDLDAIGDTVTGRMKSARSNAKD